MITLDDFTRTPTTVRLPSGREMEARAMTYRDQRCLEAAHPRPNPPMKRVAGGSLAPEEPDFKDPAYIDAFNDWGDEDTLIRAAIVVGYTPRVPAAGGEHEAVRWDDARADEDLARAWCKAVIADLGERVSIEWAEAVCKHTTDADLATLVREQSRGNSGSPSTTTTTG